MNSVFITLEELAIMTGDTPDKAADGAEWYFDFLSNDEFGPLKPFVPINGTLGQVSAKCLAWNWGERKDAVRVRLEDAQAYAAAQAAEAEAARYTTWECFTYQLDPEDRDREDRSHPVYAADGSPAFEKFLTARHIASWLARGGSPTDAPANVLALMGETGA